MNLNPISMFYVSLLIQYLMFNPFRDIPDFFYYVSFLETSSDRDNRLVIWAAEDHGHHDKW